MRPALLLLMCATIGAVLGFSMVLTIQFATRCTPDASDGARLGGMLIAGCDRRSR